MRLEGQIWADKQEWLGGHQQILGLERQNEAQLAQANALYQKLRQEVAEVNALAARAKAQAEYSETTILDLQARVRKLEFENPMAQKDLMARVDGIENKVEKALANANTALGKIGDLDREMCRRTQVQGGQNAGEGLVQGNQFWGEMEKLVEMVTRLENSPSRVPIQILTPEQGELFKTWAKQETDARCRAWMGAMQKEIMDMA